MRPALPAFFLIAVATACGGGSEDPGDDQAPVNCEDSGADMFTAGMTKPGMNGQLQFQLVSSTPAPPARDDNTWVVKVLDGQNAAVAGANVVASPYMPLHRHFGIPKEVTGTDLGEGRYELDPVNLWMPGVWEITVEATPAGGTKDLAVFSFCIPG